MHPSIKTLLFCIALIFSISGTANALTMDAGVASEGFFLSSWTAGKPNILTVSTIKFSKKAVNYALDPASATGDFRWSGGSQPDYTMDPAGSELQYAGHIGGTTSTLSIGDMTFDPGTTGKDFMTWYVDVPSTLSTDEIHFDITTEQVISRITTGSTKNLNIFLMGNVWDTAHRWVSTPATLTMSIIETVSNKGVYSYSWGSSWTTYSSNSIPEPGTIVLLGIGLTLMAAVAMRRRFTRLSI